MTKAVTPAGGSLAFDARPIELAGFRLYGRGVRAVGSPTLDQWVSATQFAAAAQESSPYWVGDLLTYAENRVDWAEKMDQAIGLTGLAHQTILNLTWISRSVDVPERVIAPSIAHAAEVAALPQPSQRKFLQKARDEEWSRSELRQAVRAAKRTKVIEGQARLEGQYRVIYADPPWTYRQNTPTASGEMTRSEERYPGMSIDEICALPIAAHVARNAVLFLWVPVPFLLQNPGPREVLEAWGFEYKGGYVWDKVHGMPGSYSYVNHEHLLIGTRGIGTPDVPISGHDHDSVQVFRREGEHSAKHKEFRGLIESLYTTGPYLELFGREKVKGWTVFGNDARLWQ